MHGQEQHDDGHEGDRGDDEVEGQGRQHAAVVEPGQEHHGENDEWLLVKSGVALHPGDGVEQEPDGNRIGRLEHGVGHDQEQAHIERHQRSDDVLCLGILAACRRDRRGNLGVDHGNAGVEQAGKPAGDEAGDHAAFADREIPAHIFADQHDADAQGPDVSGTQNTQQLQPLILLRRGSDGSSGHDQSPSDLVTFLRELDLAFAR